MTSAVLSVRPMALGLGKPLVVAVRSGSHGTFRVDGTFEIIRQTMMHCMRPGRHRKTTTWMLRQPVWQSANSIHPVLQRSLPPGMVERPGTQLECVCRTQYCAVRSPLPERGVRCQLPLGAQRSASAFELSGRRFNASRAAATAMSYCPESRQAAAILCTQQEEHAGILGSDSLNILLG